MENNKYRNTNDIDDTEYRRMWKSEDSSYEYHGADAEDIDEANADDGYALSFDLQKWNQTLRSFIGEGAETMIAAERTDRKYDLLKHTARLSRIIDKWQQICSIMDDELPSVKDMEALLNSIHCPKAPEDFGLSHSILPLTFQATKDIRDKYVLSRLCWDLGVLDEMAEML